MACDLMVPFSNPSSQIEGILDIDLIMEIPEAIHLSPLVSIQ